MPTTRRTLLERGGLLTLSALAPACARVSSAPPLAAPNRTPAMPTYEPKPLPFDPSKLSGLSETLIRSHHDNNYVGAVNKLNSARDQLGAVSADTPGYVLNGLAQSELVFKHSVVLHELYFANLVGGGSGGPATREGLSAQLGPDWETRFRALGASLGGGSGWVILEWDIPEQGPRIYAAGDHGQGLSSGVPLLVLDMYEHSYHMDYGTAAAKYIDAFFANVHWEEVARRLELASQVVVALAGG